METGIPKPATGGVVAGSVAAGFSMEVFGMEGFGIEGFGMEDAARGGSVAAFWATAGCPIRVRAISICRVTVW